MATTPHIITDMVTEIQSVANALTSYQNQLGAYLANPGSNPLPSFTTFIPQLTVDQSLTYSRVNKNSAVNSSAGVLSLTVYKAAGIVREVNTRLMSKADIYYASQGKISEHMQDTTGEAGKDISTLVGNTPAQTDGI